MALSPANLQNVNFLNTYMDEEDAIEFVEDYFSQNKDIGFEAIVEEALQHVSAFFLNYEKSSHERKLKLWSVLATFPEALKNEKVKKNYLSFIAERVLETTAFTKYLDEAAIAFTHTKRGLLNEEVAKRSLLIVKIATCFYTTIKDPGEQEEIYQKLNELRLKADLLYVFPRYSKWIEQLTPCLSELPFRDDDLPISERDDSEPANSPELYSKLALFMNDASLPSEAAAAASPSGAAKALARVLSSSPASMQTYKALSDVTVLKGKNGVKISFQKVIKLEDPSEVKIKQIAKLSFCLESMIDVYLPNFLPAFICQRPEFKKTLKSLIPSLIEKLFFKRPRKLLESDKESLISVLTPLSDFFKNYAEQKKKKISLSTIALEMLQIYKYTPESLVQEQKNLISQIVDVVLKQIDLPQLIRDQKVNVDEHLEGSLKMLVNSLANEGIENFFRPHYILKIIERLVEESIDFESFEKDYVSSTKEILDHHFSIALGTVISNLFNHLVASADEVKGLSGFLQNGIRGVAKYLGKTFIETNGNLLQKALISFLGGGCSMKPMILSFHLSLKKTENGFIPNIKSFSEPLKGNLEELIVSRIEDLSKTSFIAKVALSAGIPTLKSFISTILTIIQNETLLKLLSVIVLKSLLATVLKSPFDSSEFIEIERDRKGS